MKKILSVILALTLLLSVMPMAAFAAATDTVFNMSFDGETINATGNNNQPAWMGNNSGSKVTYKTTAGGVDDTGKMLEIKKNSTWVRSYFKPYTNETLTIGETYETSVNFKANFIGGGDTTVDSGYIKVGNFNLDKYSDGIHYNESGQTNYSAAIADGWKPLQYSYTLGSAYPKVTPAFSGSGKAATTVNEYNLDDVTVAKKYRAFFDDSNLANAGATAVGGTVELDTEVNHAKEAGAYYSQSILHSGRTALKDQAVFAKPLNNFDTNSGKAYSIWVWVKVNDASAVDSGKVVLAMADNTDVENYTMSEEVEVDKNGWAKLSLNYVMPIAEGDVKVPAGICIMQQSGEVITDINIDDVTILPMGTKAIFDTDDEVSDDIIADGTASIDKLYHYRASGRSLKVSERTALDNVISFANPISDDEFLANNSYTVNVKAMSPTAGSIVPYVEVGGEKIYGSEVAVDKHEWKEISFAFFATENPTAIGVTQKTGDVLSTIYVDDIAIAETKYYDEAYSFTTSCDDLGILTVSGKMKAEMASSAVDVKVLKSGYTIDDLETPGAVLAEGAGFADAEGNYSVTVDCTNTVDVTSNLTVVIVGLNYADGTTCLFSEIVYTNPLAVDRILEAINGAETGTALQTVLDLGTIYQDIGLNTIELPELSDYSFVCNYVVALNQDFATGEDFVSAYAKGWLVDCFNQFDDNAALAELLSQYAEDLGLNEEATYADFMEAHTDENGETDEAFTALVDSIIACEATEGIKFSDETALVKYVCDQIIMTAVNAGVNYSAKMDIFMTYADYLEVDFDAYKGLTSSGKKYVGTKIASEVASVDQFDDLQNLLDKYIAEYKASIQNSYAGGGSSSGGGGGSVSTGSNKYAGATISVNTPVATAPPVTNTDPEKPAETASRFSDIEGSHWAKESIEKLADKNIINGYEDGSFKPEKKVTRAEYVKMLITMFNVTDKKATASFSDISKDDWSYQYIATAEQMGIISGGGDGKFNPNGEITREDLVTISYRLFNAIGLELPKINEKVYFVDRTEISTYAEEAAIALQRAGIVNGVTTEVSDEFNFNPKHSATRAECAKILAGLLGFDW